MKFVWLLCAVVASLLIPATAGAGESHYEVYYFHASWRCTNCTNADAWTGEAVEAFRAANPGVTILYAPKQLETNPQLVALTGAKRVDVAIAEVSDGNILRHENLGNILSLVGSKQSLQNHVISGITQFVSASIGAGRGGPSLQSDAASGRTVGVFIVPGNPNDANPQERTLVTNILSRNFPQLVQGQKVTVGVLHSGAGSSPDWLKYFQANPGEIVVALQGAGGVESFSKLPSPTSQEQVAGFANAFGNMIRMTAQQGGL